MTERYSEETIQALRDAFTAKDTDSSGYLNADELEDCLILVGLMPTDDEIQFLKKHFDTNGDGRLSIEELLSNVHVINQHVLHREDIMEAFRFFDKNGDGYIRLPELLQVLTIKDYMSPDDARRLITELVKTYDKDGDGKFNYAEFVGIFASKVLDADDIKNT